MDSDIFALLLMLNAIRLEIRARDVRLGFSQTEGLQREADDRALEALGRIADKSNAPAPRGRD
jgi:hypothetical protein